MLDFEIVKKRIKELFKDKKGFSDEVIDAITASYIYLEDNYKDKIKDKDIPDCNNFLIDNDNSGYRSIGNIYLNRIYNNVVEFVHTNSANGCSEFVASEKRVYVPDVSDKSWNDRMSIWDVSSMNDNEKEVLMKKIRSKIIVHELIHAASFNGKSIGFIYYGESINGSIRGINLEELKKYKTKHQNLIYGSSLEEIITEILALNIVGNDNVSRYLSIVDNNKYTVASRNIDSSNFIYNGIGEYFIRVYKSCVSAKFSDGIEFLSWLNGNNGILKSETATYAILMALEKIKTNKKIDKKVGSLECKKAYALFSELQSGLLKVYKNNINVIDETTLRECIKDCIIFNDFALRVNGKVEESIYKELFGIKEKLIQVAKNNNLDFEKIYNEEKEKYLNNRKNYSLPYSNLKTKSKRKL